jgi:hypothetical protein
VAELVPLLDTNTLPGARGVPNPDGGVGVRAIAFMDIDVAVDPANGNLYAVWEDARFSNLQNYDIAFAMSSDGGLTWSAPIKVNQTPATVPIGDRQAIIPSVAVNSDGVVAVTYYDFRNNTSAPGLLTDYWMVHADPDTDFTNPSSWASENRLTDDSFNMELAPIEPADGYFVGEYQGLSALGSHFGAFWAMPHPNRDGTNDMCSIFYRDPLAADDSAHDVRPSSSRAHQVIFRAVTGFDPGILDQPPQAAGTLGLPNSGRFRERTDAASRLTLQTATDYRAFVQDNRSEAAEEFPAHGLLRNGSETTDELGMQNPLEDALAGFLGGWTADQW